MKTPNPNTPIDVNVHSVRILVERKWHCPSCGMLHTEAHLANKPLSQAEMYSKCLKHSCQQLVCLVQKS